MNDETPKKKLAQFDFPLGATPEQIAEATRKTFAELIAKKGAP